MSFKKRVMAYPLFTICLILFVGVISIVFLAYHRLTDYDIAKELLSHSIPVFAKPNHQMPLSQIKHVFVIVEENKDWSRIKGNSQAPFINNSLLTQGSFASQYYNVPKNLAALHPSEPNYILMEAGMIAFADHTFTTNDIPSAKNSTSSQNHFVKLLEKKRLTWKSYQEDISGTNCPIVNVNKYATKHNPYVFFQDIVGNPPSMTNTYCKEHNRPFEELQADLRKGSIANYVFITPNLENDMHDGSIVQGDVWLSKVVPMITGSETFKKDGALFITWDEGSTGSDDNNPVGMIMLSPFIKAGYTNNTAYSHTSYLKTIQEIFNVSPLLGSAADFYTQDLSDFFKK